MKNKGKDFDEVLSDKTVHQMRKVLRLVLNEIEEPEIPEGCSDEYEEGFVAGTCYAYEIMDNVINDL